MVQGGAQGENHIWNSISNTPPFTHEMGRSGLFLGREQLDLLCPSFFLGLLYDEMCCVVLSILALLLIFLRLRERRYHRFLRALRFAGEGASPPSYALSSRERDHHRFLRCSSLRCTSRFGSTLSYSIISWLGAARLCG